MKCLICKIELDDSTAYEYRGEFACEKHLAEMRERREFQRQEIITEERAKTEKFRGLDLSDTPIGKANREILAPAIEIASKESGRLKDYERRRK